MSNQVQMQGQTTCRSGAAGRLQQRNSGVHEPGTWGRTDDFSDQG